MSFAVFIFSIALINSPAAEAKGNPRYASIVMDADTGLILSQRYADKKLHPASLTKLMTLMMVFDALDSGKIGLRDRVYISKHAAGMVPSKLDLPAGSTIRVEDAIYSLVTKSANDVAVALGEHIGGTESNFARMMTAKAHEIGMTQTTFRNASGLHSSRQVSTARDMAKLARTLINTYGSHYHYFSTKQFSYRGKTYRSHNRLMSSYKGMDGMKTGYVAASGFNLVSSAVRNNQRLIGVVFGGRTSRSRNAHMAALLDNGFEKLYDIRLASIQVPVPPRKPGIILAYNALTQMNPATKENTTKWAMLNPALSHDAFAELIGEGDSDEDELRRIKTGLIAISALKGEKIPEKYSYITSSANDNIEGVQLASYQPTNNWAVQIGAFKSRSRTDKAIQKSLKKLPTELRAGTATIVPLRTGNNDILFRGRLSGYSEQQAKKACKYIKDCIPVPPSSPIIR